MSSVVKAGVVGVALLAGAKAVSTMDLSMDDIEVATAKVIQIAAADSGTDEGVSKEKTKPKGGNSEGKGEDPSKPKPQKVTAEPKHMNGLPELLVDIAAERIALKAREEIVGEKEAELKLYEAAVEEQRRQLAILRDEIDRLLDDASSNHVNDLTRLVNIYNAMKPDQAAGILNDADIAVAVQVLVTMEERSSGPILAEMNPVRARAISKIIFERSRLPADQDLVGIKFN